MSAVRHAKREEVMTDYCEVFKAKLVDLLGRDLSDKAKLVALAELAGIADKEELQRLLECGASTLRTARSALKNERSKSSAARNQALENEQKCSKSSETLEIKRSKSSALACATKELPPVVSSYSDKQTNTREDVCSSGTGAALKAEFNGSTENLIADVLAWMGPSADRGNAVKWLTSMLSLHGRDTVLASYQQIVASQAKGDLIANPISYFSKVAAGIKAKGPAVAKQADVLPFKVTTAMNVKPRLDPPMVVANA